MQRYNILYNLNLIAMYTLMTNNQLLIAEYKELNILAVLLLIAVVTVIVWYKQSKNFN